MAMLTRLSEQVFEVVYAQKFTTCINEEGGTSLEMALVRPGELPMAKAW